jgi:hypothetical protein
MGFYVIESKYRYTLYGIKFSKKLTFKNFLINILILNNLIFETEEKI